MNLASALPLAILIVVVVGLRARRTMTSQLVRPVMLIGRLVVLGLLSIVLLLGMVPQTMMFLGIVIGLGIGLVLAFYSLKHTQFESAHDGLRYKTNPYIGGIVLLLVVLRIVVDIHNSSSIFQNQNSSHATMAISQGPLTVFLYFLFLGYWMFYYIGVLRRSRDLLKEPPATN